MTYEINLDVYYQTFDNFKQKKSLILRNLFKYGRIQNYVSYHSYGIISTLSKKADKIFVEETPSFNRFKTNCIIFNLSYNKYNPGKYDMLLIYRTCVNKDDGYYGYILYNSKTGKILNKYYIEQADDKLAQYIYNSIHTLAKDKLYDHYSKKYDALKNRNGLTLRDVPTLKDWKEMHNYYNEFIKKPFILSELNN